MNNFDQNLGPCVWLVLGGLLLAAGLALTWFSSYVVLSQVGWPPHIEWRLQGETFVKVFLLVVYGTFFCYGVVCLGLGLFGLLMGIREALLIIRKKWNTRS